MRETIEPNRWEKIQDVDKRGCKRFVGATGLSRSYTNYLTIFFSFEEHCSLLVKFSFQILSYGLKGFLKGIDCIDTTRLRVFILAFRRTIFRLRYILQTSTVD